MGVSRTWGAHCPSVGVFYIPLCSWGVHYTNNNHIWRMRGWEDEKMTGWDDGEKRKRMIMMTRKTMMVVWGCSQYPPLLLPIRLLHVFQLSSNRYSQHNAKQAVPKTLKLVTTTLISPIQPPLDHLIFVGENHSSYIMNQLHVVLRSFLWKFPHDKIPSKSSKLPSHITMIYLYLHFELFKPQFVIRALWLNMVESPSTQWTFQET